MSDKPIIIVDSDGVIVDLDGPWLRIYNEMYNDSLTKEQFFSDWEIHERAKCGEDVYDIIKQPDFFKNLPAIPGAVESFQKWNEVFDLYIATAVSQSGEVCKGKMDWIAEHMPWLNRRRVFMCKYKSMIKGDWLIDDSHKNIKEWEKTGRSAVMINAPWNKNYKPTWYRADTLEEAFKMINLSYE